LRISFGMGDLHVEEGGGVEFAPHARHVGDGGQRLAEGFGQPVLQADETGGDEPHRHGLVRVDESGLQLPEPAGAPQRAQVVEGGVVDVALGRRPTGDLESPARPGSPQAGRG
jgi:hypothetical protein